MSLGRLGTSEELNLIFHNFSLQENQLKLALLDFIRRYHPNDKEAFKTILIGFGMYRENAQHLEQTGHEEINNIKGKLTGEAVKPYLLITDDACSNLRQ